MLDLRRDEKKQGVTLPPLVDQSLRPASASVLPASNAERQVGQLSEKTVVSVERAGGRVCHPPSYRLGESHVRAVAC